MKNFVKWGVALTGVYDLLVGAALIASVRPSDPVQQATWALLLTQGGFLLFAGAVLIWAAQDLQARGALVLWQALLRLWAAGVLLAGIASGFYPADATAIPCVAALVDACVAVFYVAALVGVWRLSPLRLLLGLRSPPQLQR